MGPRISYERGSATNSLVVTQTGDVSEIVSRKNENPGKGEFDAGEFD
jgi:hypothetical protein